MSLTACASWGLICTLCNVNKRMYTWAIFPPRLKRCYDYPPNATWVSHLFRNRPHIGHYSYLISYRLQVTLLKCNWQCNNFNCLIKVTQLAKFDYFFIIFKQMFWSRFKDFILCDGLSSVSALLYFPRGLLVLNFQYWKAYIFYVLSSDRRMYSDVSTL